MPSLAHALPRIGAAFALGIVAVTAGLATPTLATAATPVPTPAAASATASPSAVTDGQDPSLATMNANGDHSMGSTIPAAQDDTATSGSTVQSKLRINSALTTQTAGLDVSAYQGNVDWSSAYSNGARFAYVKATEGTTYTNAYFSQQYDGSYTAGMTRGAYVFATPNTSTGAAQAKYFVAHGGGWSADGRTLPPLLDIEYGYSATCWGLSQTAMVSWIKDFTATMKSLTGISPAIYSTTDWWTQCTGNSSAFSADPLFIAHYTTATTPGTLPASWSAWTFWQHADSGTFPGDQDYFDGTTAALKTVALAGKTATSTSTSTSSSTSTSTTTTTTKPVAGTSLKSGQSVTSPNGQYTVTMQSDGNLVEYGNGKALWSTGTNGNAGAYFTAQSDGNAVVYSAAGKALWNSKTGGDGTAPKFEAESSGVVALVSTSGTTWKETPTVTTLAAGTTLKAGQYLHTSAGDTVLEMQTDGNLVSYVDGKAVWSTKTSGHAGARAILQTDGNLVVYSTSNAALWNSKTGGKGAGTHLTLATSGSVTLSLGTTTLWASTKSTAPATSALASELTADERLGVGASISNSTGTMRLVMQGDGNLVLYKGDTAKWSSKTNGYPGATVLVQSDGNVVVYDKTGKARWDSRTNGAGTGTRLVLQTDGNLVLYKGTKALWNTKTFV